MPAKKAKKIHPMRCIRNLYLYQEPSFVKMDQNPLNIVSKTLLLLTFSREQLSWQNSVVDTRWTTKSQTKTCAVRTTVTIRLPVVFVLSFRRWCLSSRIALHSPLHSLGWKVLEWFPLLPRSYLANLKTLLRQWHRWDLS